MRSLFPPCLALSALATLANGATTPDLDAWRKVQLGNAAADANQWYFHPESDGSPRVLVKTASTGVNVTRRLLTGGPPVWTTGSAMTTPELNKQGVAVQRENGIYLIAPYNDELRLTFFNADGTAKFSKLVDTDASITSVGLSAAIDPQQNLHIVYVGNPGTASETLRYARLSANGQTWVKDTVETSSLAQYVQQTVILPTAETSAKIYASLKSTTATSLLRRTINQYGIVAASGDGNLTPGVTISEHIAGNRNNNADCVYYFSKPINGSTWSLKQASVTTAIKEVGNVLPTSIISKAGPDGKQRIAWLDGTGKTIHYMKATGSGSFDVSQPVKDTTGTAEVRGLHFDANDKPYLLYRNSGTAGFIAYPDENQDTNGNGRPDLLDVAFNSNTAGVQVLDPVAAAPGLPLSQTKFKFRIPTVGAAIANGAGGLFSDTLKLTYNVETSTNGIAWTTLGAGSPLIWVLHSTDGDVRVYSGMYNETIPAAPSKRFFRIKVTRPAGAY